MVNRVNEFWGNFQSKNFSEALKHFDKLNESEKQDVFAELFQKSEYHRKPIMVSVLRGKLHNNKNFDDFYQSWFPTEDMRNPKKIHGQVFQNHFPAPVRVLNAVNINDPSEIVSIGITWVSSEKEEQALWEYLQKASQGEDENNEARHDRIKQVADRELLGLFRVETDDNLGTPF